uniref:Uncharacterized protein n=1 Tax=Arundo donax TaxID=35708 RepID=A0A0A9GSQ6_ARUDO
MLCFASYISLDVSQMLLSILIQEKCSGLEATVSINDFHRSALPSHFFRAHVILCLQHRSTSQMFLIMILNPDRL